MAQGYIKGEHRDPRIGSEEIEHRFGFHKATIEGENATLPKHREVRLLFREFAEKLDNLIPTSREKSVAFTELEKVEMWVHKAIAMDAPLIEEEREFDFNEIAMPVPVSGQEEWDKLSRAEQMARVRSGLRPKGNFNG